MLFRKRATSQKLAVSKSESATPQIDLTAPPQTLVLPAGADAQSAPTAPAIRRPDPTLGLAIKRLREGGRNLAPSSDDAYRVEDLSPAGSTPSL